MAVIVIANQKGGVGKTTTAVNLGASLAAAEQRTLVIDLDPQGNATSGLGVRAPMERISLYQVLMDHQPLGEAVVRSVHLPHLDVLPATLALASAEVELVGEPRREQRLRHALDSVRHVYDYVLIDCSPKLGMLTLNGLVAAESALIPMQPEFFSMEGLADFLDTLRFVQDRLNPRLKLEGILLTLFNAQLNLTKQVEEELMESLQAHILETRIPRNVRLAEAPSFGQPVLLYDINSPGAQSYLALAREMMRRTAPRLERAPLAAAR